MLFPKDSPQFYESGSKEIIDRMEQFYNESISQNQAYWVEASIDSRFEAGDQDVFAEIYGAGAVRNNFTFNRITRIINMIDGYQRRNRKSLVAVPVENSDDTTTDQFSKILMWIIKSDNALDTVSDAFRGALITGMNLLHVWNDFRNDPVSGDIKIDNCSYNSFLIDPFFKKTDMSDCNAIWKRSFVTTQDAISLFPSKKEEIASLYSRNSSKDSKFTFMPQNRNFNNKDLMSYDEYYYKTYRRQKLLIDTQTGESFEWTSDDKGRLNAFLKLYPQVTVSDNEISTVRLAVVLNGSLLYDGPNPLGIDRYPFVPVFGYYRPDLPLFSQRVQGLVRGLRDTQYLYNRRKNIELNMLESTINSGWKVKENAVINFDDLHKTGEGHMVVLRQESQMSDVEKIEPGQVPPSVIELSRMLGEEFSIISGANEELLGGAIDDKAGVLAALRQGAGLTTLQLFFDNLDESLENLGKILIDSIQANFTPGKIQRIVNEQPSDQFYNKAFGKYDCAVEEGLNTSTQRQMQFAQLINLRELGIQIPDDLLIEASTLQNKKALVDAIKQAQQQQAQQQQVQSQASLGEIEARTELAKARALADRGLGVERISRVKENQALAFERAAEASKDYQAGLLDMAKTMKELESIDIQQLEKLIALARVFDAKNEEIASQVSPINDIQQQQFESFINQDGQQGPLNE